MIILYLLIAVDIFTFYFVISSFSTKKNIEVTCVIILFYYLSEKHSMNVKKIVCVAKMFVKTSRTCVVCLPKKCIANLHDNSKSNMAAIVNKVYSQGWSGSSMKWRLMRANLFTHKLICPH